MLTSQALALRLSLQQRANARNVSTSLLPYSSITYFINSFHYSYLFYRPSFSSLLLEKFVVWLQWQ